MNVQVDELVIRSYKCPECGQEVQDTGFYSKFFEHGVFWLMDTTICCNTYVAWLPINGILLYVGSFESEQEFVDWADSAGAISHWLPVGSLWDHNAQGPRYDVDEIPF